MMTDNLIVDSANPAGRPMTEAEQAEYEAHAAAHAAKAPPDALERLAAKRYAVMAGGIAIAALGFSIRTDDASLARIGLVAQGVALGVAPEEVPWKAADGSFHMIAPADVGTIFGLAAGHVAACFAREAELAAAIAAAEDPAAVDIATGWPSNG